MASTRKNFVYNLMLTLCNYVFPLITYPYVSRVLGVTNIGICNFVDSIIDYYVLFSTLGTASYGVRAIAKYVDDRQKRDEIFSSLFVINLITTFVFLIILFITTHSLERLAPYRDFLYIGSLKLVFSLFQTNWLFQGMSDFKYITVRSVIVRCIFVVLVFLFVRTSNDAKTYFFLICLTIVLNAIVNWNYGRRYRKFDFKKIKLSCYIYPVLTYGFYNILTSMYTTFNTLFLGLISGDKEVGLFTTATKLYFIIMSVFTAFTTVMVPRIAKLVKDKNYADLQSISKDTLELVVVFSLPIIVFCELNAEEMIFLLSGKGFEGAVVVFRIVILLLIVIGFEQIIIQQFLMALNSNSAIIRVCLTGAFFGLLANFILTPVLYSVGSAISWGISEFAVLMVGIFLVKKLMKLPIDFVSLVRKLSIGLIYVVPICLFLGDYNRHFCFICSGFYMLFSFLVINLLIDRNQYVVEMWNRIVGKIYLIR